MRATNLAYDVQQSSTRIEEILNASDNTYEDKTEVPSEDLLTFTNGFYVDVTALYIDIRKSTQLAAAHTRPVLGKLYRAYISECVAIINSNEKCSQIFIEGDAVIGVFSTPNCSDVDKVFETAGQLSSLNILLNHHFAGKGYSTIDCGVGIADGKALMIKTGHKGSTVNEIVWIGKVLGEAAHLSYHGNRDGKLQLQVSTRVHQLIKNGYKNFLKPVYAGGLTGGIVQYEASIGDLGMHNWLIDTLGLPLNRLTLPEEQ